MTVGGAGPWIRRNAAGDGVATWRGMSLGMTATQAITTFDALAWDVLFAQTDGIRSTTTNGPYGSSITVPTGAAGVVPAGMGGLWRLSGNCDVYPSDTPVFFAFSIVVNDFDPFWEDDHADDSYPTDFNLTIASFVVELAEGDVVWTNFTGPADAGGADATFLMEYLGTLS